MPLSQTTDEVSQLMPRTRALERDSAKRTVDVPLDLLVSQFCAVAHSPPMEYIT